MITTPAPIAATRICGVISGPSSVTPPAVRSQAAATCASSDAGRRAERRPEHAEQRALGDDDPHDLAAGGAGGAQQPELADALDRRSSRSC